MRSGTLRPDSANGSCQYQARGANFCRLSLSCDSVFKILLALTSGIFTQQRRPSAKSYRGEIKLVCNGFGGDTSRADNVIQNFVNDIAVRFQAQDDAGGPEWRRPDQSLPPTRSKAEERHHHWNKRVGPAEQNLPLPDLRRPREL